MTQVDLKTLAREFPTERVSTITANAYQLERLLDPNKLRLLFPAYEAGGPIPRAGLRVSSPFQATSATDVSKDLQDFLELPMHMDTEAS